MKGGGQIGKELLAVVFGCEKFHVFLCGMKNSKVETDYKPLVPIINKMQLD